MIGPLYIGTQVKTRYPIRGVTGEVVPMGAEGVVRDIYHTGVDEERYLISVSAEVAFIAYKHDVQVLVEGT